MVERAGNWRLDVSISCPSLNNHVNLGKCLNLPGPQVVYLGMGKDICPTYHLRLLTTMKLNNTCESHLWNVECHIKFVIIVTVDIISPTMPDITGYLVPTCSRCFRNIPLAKCYSLGALRSQAGILWEPVEKWWLITENRNVRNLWAAHLQSEFILPIQPARFSLKAVTLQHVRKEKRKRVLQTQISIQNPQTCTKRAKAMRMAKLLSWGSSMQFVFGVGVWLRKTSCLCLARRREGGEGRQGAREGPGCPFSRGGLGLGHKLRECVLPSYTLQSTGRVSQPPDAEFGPWSWFWDSTQ